MIMQIRKILKENKGFTLMELIVVIAILGVLSGITAPNVVRYVEKSRQRVDLANATTIANVVLAGIADGEIKKYDYNSGIILKTGAPGSISNVIKDSLQSDIFPTPKFNTEFLFAVWVDDDAKVAVGLVDKDKAQGDLTVTDITKLYPVNNLDY